MTSHWDPPIHLLHRNLKDAIDQIALTESAETILAGNFDGYIAQSTGPLYEVKGHNGEVTPTNAYIMKLAKTGSAKTPLTVPFIDEQARLECAYDSEVADLVLEHQVDIDLYKATVEGLRREARKRAADGKEIIDELRAARLEVEKNKPIPPPECARRVVDLSYRSWIEQAKRHPATYFLLDETSGFFSALDRPLIAALCASWNRVPHQYARGAKSAVTFQAVPTIVLNVHPDNYTRLLKTAMGRHWIDAGGDGRFMHYVASENGHVVKRRGGKPDFATLKPIFERGEALFREQIGINQGSPREPVMLELSEGACREMRDFERSLSRLREQAMNDAELALIEKSASNVLRHAGRHHAFFEKTGQILAEEVGDSIEWVRWCIDGYFQFTERGQVSGRNVESDADALLYHMRYGTREGSRGKLDKRKLFEEAFNIGFTRISEFNQALSLLCQQDYAAVKDGVVYWEMPDVYAGKLSKKLLHFRR